MKSLFFSITFFLCTNILFSQNINISGTGVYKHNYSDTLSINQYNTYNILFEIDNNNTNNLFYIKIFGLTNHIGKRFNLLIKEFNTQNNKYIISDDTIKNDTLITPLINVSSLGIEGIFVPIIQKYNDSSTLEFFPNDLIVIEKAVTVNIPGITGYKFLIHYSDNFFVNHPLNTAPAAFVNNYISNALLETWQKEINEWDLCKGLTGNIPQDKDKIYHIYIHNMSEIIGYFNNDQLRANPLYGDRRIYFDSRPTDILNATSNISEKELIYSLISHEFYHGIQFSHMSWDSIVNNFSNPATELQKRNWLLEGQAKFLETVFMEDYSDSSNNVTYIQNTHNHSYGDYTAQFLKEALDKDYQYNII